MNIYSEKDLILSLIKDDLTHSKLLFQLNEIGLDTSDHYLNLPDTIFRLLEFKNDHLSETIYQQYRRLVNDAMVLNKDQFRKSLDAVAVRIYSTLLTK